MEVHHQPAFLSGGGGAENPGENYIQAIGIVKKKYFNFFIFLLFLQKMYPAKISDVILLVSDPLYSKALLFTL